MIMSASRTSDASTSTDDAMKGRPLCLFYFTHPFGVLSPEPPTVVMAPRPGYEPAGAGTAEPHPPREAEPPERRGAVGPLDVMAGRRCTLDLGSGGDALSSSLFSSDVQFGWSSGSTVPGRGCLRRVPYGRTLPPLRLPAPREPSARAPRLPDLWPAGLAYPERISLPPIEMPTSTDTERSPAPVQARRGRLGAGGGAATGTPRRAGAGVRKAQARRGPDGSTRRSGTRAALVRLLRRAITGGGGGGEGERERGGGALVAALAAAWRPLHDDRSTEQWETPAPTQRSDEAEAMAPAGRPAPPPPPPPPHRRYSVPETVMRKYNLARQRSDPEETVLSSPCPALPASLSRATPSPALRRLWRTPAPEPLSPCRCGRAVDSAPHYTRRPSYGERCYVTPSSPFHLYDSFRNDSTREPHTDDVTVAVPPYDTPTTDVLPTDTPPTDEPSRCDSSPTAYPHSQCDLLEIVVSEAVRLPRTLPPPRTPYCHTGTVPAIFGTSSRNLNIDEYVSSVLVESLNSLSDRLETVTASLVGDGKMSIVEKEIKVKLQNTGVNTIVHLSPTSNNQIIFGNEELYEQHDVCDYRVVAPAPVDACPAVASGEEDVERAALRRLRRLFRDSLPPAAPPWLPPRSPGRDSRGGSPCASLVDSLDSPRVPPRSSAPTTAPPQPTPPSPLRPAPHKDKGEAFFVGIKDDDCDNERTGTVVADHMPESLKQRLQRRHRRRELRMECARRSRAEREARLSGEEGEVRWGRGRGRGPRVAFDGIVTVVPRRTAKHAGAVVIRPTLESVDDASRVRYRSGRCPRSTGSITLGEASTRSSPDAVEVVRLDGERSTASHLERGPRRLYHKSEICDGGECIEILEIVEYATASRSSSETVSEESLRCTATAKRSRIPVPVRRAVPAATEGPAPSPAPAVAPAPAPAPPLPCALPEPRARSHSLRFERVFDVIPEERGAGAEPYAEAAAPAVGRRTAAPPPRPRRPAEPPPPPGTIGSSGEGSVESGRRRIAARLGEAGGCGVGRWRERRSPPAPRPRSRPADETSGCAGASSADSDSPPTRGADRRGGARAPRWPAVPRARRRLRRVTHSSRRSSDTGGGGGGGGAGGGGGGAGGSSNTGGWSVTVAGSGGAALPADVEMRLRFPPARHEGRPHPPPSAQHGAACSACSACSWCGCRRCAPRSPPALAACKRAHRACDVTPPSRRRAPRSPLPALAAPTPAPAAARRTSDSRTPEDGRGRSLGCARRRRAAAPAPR